MSWHQDDEYEKKLEKEYKPGSKAARPSVGLSFFLFLILLGVVLVLQRTCIMYEW